MSYEPSPMKTVLKPLAGYVVAGALVALLLIVLTIQSNHRPAFDSQALADSQARTAYCLTSGCNVKAAAAYVAPKSASTLQVVNHGIPVQGAAYDLQAAVLTEDEQPASGAVVLTTASSIK